MPWSLSSPVRVQPSTAAPLAAVAAVALTARVGASWALPAFLYLAVLGAVLAIVDVKVHRLPDALVLPAYPISLGLLALAAAAEGAWSSYGRALCAGAVLWTAYLVLALAYPGGMGFGDVKLSGVLGVHLGWLGWAEVAAGTLLAFVLGGLIGIALMVSGRASRRSAIAFGPCMLAGALLGCWTGGALASAY